MWGTTARAAVHAKKGEGRWLDQAVAKHRKVLAAQEKAEQEVTDALARLREVHSALTAAQAEEKVAALEVEQARQEVATKLECGEKVPIPFEMMGLLMVLEFRACWPLPQNY